MFGEAIQQPKKNRRQLASISAGEPAGVALSFKLPSFCDMMATDITNSPSNPSNIGYHWGIIIHDIHFVLPLQCLKKTKGFSSVKLTPTPFPGDASANVSSANVFRGDPHEI